MLCILCALGGGDFKHENAQNQNRLICGLIHPTLNVAFSLLFDALEACSRKVRTQLNVRISDTSLICDSGYNNSQTLQCSAEMINPLVYCRIISVIDSKS